MKLDDSYDPYKAAYAAMPSHASSNPEVKQLYINGHFCYVFKFGMISSQYHFCNVFINNIDENLLLNLNNLGKKL